MNLSDHPIIQGFVRLHHSSPLPCLICGADLRVFWYNDAARENYPDLCAADLGGLLAGYDIDALLCRLSGGESLSPLLVMPPFLPTPLHMMPCMEDGRLIGVVVMPPPVQRQDGILGFSDVERAAFSFSNGFRSPLSIVFSALTPLTRRIDADDREGQAYLRHIMLSCYQMLRNTVNISEMVTLLDRAGLSMQNGDLRTFSGELFEGASHFFAGDERITFRYSLPSKPIFTAFDPERLANALLSVMLNAAESSETQPVTIMASLTLADGQAVFHISDDGPGISSADLPHVFEPYFSTGTGIGLGLTVCHRIITGHGGTIAIQSAEGKGCTVACYLPVRPDYRRPSYVTQHHTNLLNNRFSPLFLHLSAYNYELLTPRTCEV